MVNKTNRLLFGYSSPEFINLYSEENPILGVDEKCYFMLTNLVDIHRPIICYGTIKVDYYSNDMNKVYYIELEKIFEEPEIINRYFHNQMFMVHKVNETGVSASGCVRKIVKKYLLKTEQFLEKHLLPIEAFFVRPELNDLVHLREKYVQIIIDDMKKNILEASKINGVVNPIPYTPKTL